MKVSFKLNRSLLSDSMSPIVERSMLATVMSRWAQVTRFISKMELDPWWSQSVARKWGRTVQALERGLRFPILERLMRARAASQWRTAISIRLRWIFRERSSARASQHALAKAECLQSTELLMLQVAQARAERSTSSATASDSSAMHS